MGKYGQIYFFLQSVVLGRLLGIRSDLKCLSKMSFWGDFDRYIFPTICRFGEIFGIRSDLKCLSKMSFWGDLDRYIFFLQSVIFGNQKRPKMSSKCHFGEIFGNLVSGKANFSKKKFRRSAPNLEKKYKYCHFGEISALQYMSFWGDFRVKIKNNKTWKKKNNILYPLRIV